MLCEDTRRTQILLDRYEIRARRLVSFHRHNEASRTQELLPRLLAGETLALVSDAGLPGVNDPGSRLVVAGARRRPAGHRAPGRERGGDRARRERSRHIAVPLPRLPAAARDGAARPVGRRPVVALRRGRVRIASAAGARPRGARAGESGAAGRRLPRADEALRGGRPGHRCRPRRPLSRAGQGRGDRRDRRRGSSPRARRDPEPPSTRCASSSMRVRRGAWPWTSSRASRAPRGTSSTARRWHRRIDAVRRRRYPSIPALPAQRTKEVSRAPIPRARRNARRGTRAERRR